MMLAQIIILLLYVVNLSLQSILRALLLFDKMIMLLSLWIRITISLYHNIYYKLNFENILKKRISKTQCCFDFFLGVFFPESKSSSFLIVFRFGGVRFKETPTNKVVVVVFLRCVLFTPG